MHTHTHTRNYTTPLLRRYNRYNAQNEGSAGMNGRTFKHLRIK